MDHTHQITTAILGDPPKEFFLVSLQTKMQRTPCPTKKVRGEKPPNSHVTSWDSWGHLEAKVSALFSELGVNTVL